MKSPRSRIEYPYIGHHYRDSAAKSEVPPPMRMSTWSGQTSSSANRVVLDQWVFKVRIDRLEVGTVVSPDRLPYARNPQKNRWSATRADTHVIAEP